MEKKVKLAILCLVLAISPMPIAIFSIVHWEYIAGFFDGSAVVKIDSQKGWMEICSNTIRLIPLRISLIELALIITATAIFCVCLMLVVRIYLQIKNT